MLQERAHFSSVLFVYICGQISFIEIYKLWIEMYKCIPNEQAGGDDGELNLPEMILGRKMEKPSF